MMFLSEIYEWLIDKLDDYELAKVVESRRKKRSEAVEVSLGDL